MYGLSNEENIFDIRWPLRVEGQGQNLKTLKSNISITVRDREKMSIGVRWEVVYGLSNKETIFDLKWPLKVKGQIVITLKSNISFTVRDRENVNRSYIGSELCMGFRMAKIFLTSCDLWTSEGQSSGSNPIISMIVGWNNSFGFW